MEFYLELVDTWELICDGLIGSLSSILNSSIPSMILDLFGVSNPDSLDGAGEFIYNLIYDILDVIPFGASHTFAEMTLMSLMLGIGLLFVIVYTIAKWIINVIP